MLLMCVCMTVAWNFACTWICKIWRKKQFSWYAHSDVIWFHFIDIGSSLICILSSKCVIEHFQHSLVDFNAHSQTCMHAFMGLCHLFTIFEESKWKSRINEFQKCWYECIVLLLLLFRVGWHGIAFEFSVRIHIYDF